jgi:ATP-binding cassette subfamily B protein/subfamily B ATP-binding cassette protein MsbA
MKCLFKYLKQGLTRTCSKDRIGSASEPAGLRVSLRNLRPFVRRHWRKGLLGSFLIILTSVLSFSQPLITRYPIDQVILGRQLSLLAGVIFLLAVITLTETLLNVFQQFYFARF